MGQWHVLGTPDGRYAANHWEIFNTSLRRPRLGFTAELNHPITSPTVVCVYPSFDEAIGDCARFNDILGEVTFPIPVEFHGEGPRAVMTVAPP